MDLSQAIDRRFHIRRRNSSILQEATGGATTFANMVYIIPVTAGMCAAVGVDNQAAAMALAIVTGLITIIMGVVANIPVGLSTGMGLNAFATLTVCGAMGYSYETVMLCTFIEGVIFFVLSLTGVRSAMANALPASMKAFIGAGIGGFIMFIGGQNAHLIVKDDSTLTKIVTFHADFSTTGVTATLAVIGVLIMAILMACQVKAAVIIGIVITWGLGIICQLAGVYVPNPEIGQYSLLPSFQRPTFSAFSKMFVNPAKIHIDLNMIGNIVMVTAIMFYSDFFDTVGTCVTCLRAIAAQMREEITELRKKYADSRRPPRKIEEMEAEVAEIESERTTKLALLIDALGTIIGSIFRLPTITSFVEAIAGISAGARTGFASVVTGILFLSCIFFASFFTAIPSFATGAALIVVGASMFFGSLKQIEWKTIRFNELFSGAACVLFTILSYNIANGMAAGIISYTLITPFTKGAEKPKLVFWILTVLLILKFCFL